MDLKVAEPPPAEKAAPAAAFLFDPRAGHFRLLAAFGAEFHALARANKIPDPNLSPTFPFDHEIDLHYCRHLYCLHASREPLVRRRLGRLFHRSLRRANDGSRSRRLGCHGRNGGLDRRLKPRRHRTRNGSSFPRTNTFTRSSLPIIRRSSSRSPRAGPIMEPRPSSKPTKGSRGSNGASRRTTITLIDLLPSTRPIRDWTTTAVTPRRARGRICGIFTRVTGTSNGSSNPSPAPWPEPPPRPRRAPMCPRRSRPRIFPREPLRLSNSRRARFFPAPRATSSFSLPRNTMASKPACVYVKTDGFNPKEQQFLERMIATKEIPVTVGVFVRPGDVPATIQGHHGTAQSRPRIRRHGRQERALFCRGNPALCGQGI